MKPDSPDSSRLVAFDAMGIFVVSLAICLASHQLAFMTVLVPVIFLARMLILAAWAEREQISLSSEVIFLGLCTLLGAFNDWNSVCNKQIYNYTVPHYFAFSTIPVWMLLYWGLILRFLARLARWENLHPDPEPSNRIGMGRFQAENAVAKVAAQLLLLAATRWFIYRYPLHPVLSWLPFLIALLLYALIFKVNSHDLKLVGLFLVAGPLVEVLYIQIGHLHQYHLGWIGGVPLWIVLWWALSILIWKDIALRIEKALRRKSSTPLNI